MLRLSVVTWVAGILVAVTACGDSAAVVDAPVDTTVLEATLHIDRTTGPFGSITLGQMSAATPFVITNSGTGPTGLVAAALSGSGAASFVISNNACPPMLEAGASCTVDVRFVPASSGAKTATLEVSATPGGTVSAALDGEGVALGALTVMTTTSALGNVVIGATGTTISTFTVTNTGGTPTGPLSLQAAGADPADFSKGIDQCSDTVLAPAGTCTFEALFTPHSRGAKSGQFRITASPGGSVSGSITGTALAPASLIVLQPDREFGSVVTGSASSPLTVTVINAGDVDSGTLSETFTGTDRLMFSSTGATTCGGSPLAAGTSCTITLRFSPSSTGSKMAQLSVTDPSGLAVGVALSGTGITATQLTIDPTAHAFGNTNVGQTGTARLFTITNSGGAPTGTLAASITGVNAPAFRTIAGSDRCTGVSLPVGGTCTISIAFSPTIGGTASALLTVSGSPGGTVTAGLSGVAIPAASLTIEPPSRGFGGVTMGSQSAALAFTIRNLGGQASGVPTASISGTSAGQFTIAGNNCTAAIGPGASCQINLRFAPTTTGAATASLAVAATPGGSLTAGLTGDGLVPAQLAITPSSYPFPPTAVGDSSVVQTLTVQNTGTAMTSSINVATTGDFSTVNDCGPLPAGATCTLTVTFTPTAIGAHTGSVTVSGTPGGTASAALSGAAVPRLEIISLGGGPIVTPFDFGNGVITSSAALDLAITVRNNTSSTKPFSLLPSFAGQYTVISNTCSLAGAIGSGAICTVTVRFAPTTIGTKTGSLTFAIASGVANEATQAFTGNGIESLTLTALTGTTFGSVPIGTTSAPLTFQLTNPSGSAITGPVASSITAGAMQISADGCTGPSLAPGASCLIQVRYAPTAVGPAATTTLAVTASPGGSPSLALTGTGVSPTGAIPTDIQLAPSSVLENSPTATVVGALTTTDADPADTFVYSLVAGAGSADNAAFSIVGAEVRTNGVFDFETTSSYAIRVRSTDSGGQTFEKALTITVTNVDDPPTAINDSVVVLEDSGATAINVLANDTDSDGGPKTIASVTQPANGTVMITGGGSGLTYQPAANYSGADPFSYTLVGGSVASVSVTVTAVDDPPVAVADLYSVVEDSTANPLTVLVNDTDIDGGPKTITGVTQPANGTATVNGNGTTIFFAPAPNAVGIAEFTYTLNGGSTAMVTVVITALDDPPVAVNDSATVNEESGANPINVLGNDTDVDGGPKMIISVVQPTHGTVVITGGGTGVTYAPNANYQNTSPAGAADTFTYTLNGGSIATVSVTVTNVDDPPSADDDTFSVVEDSGANTLAVLANDDDTDGGPMTIITTTNGAFGTVAITNGGADLTYTPNANYCSTTADTFTYTLNGGDMATVTVTVTCVNDAPTDIALSRSDIDEGPGGRVVGLLSRTDPEPADGFTFTLDSTIPACASTNNSAFTITGNMLQTATAFTYPAQSSLTICIRVTDDGSPAAFRTEQFTITVNDVNDPPSDIMLSNTTLAEAQPSGTAVGTLSATDAVGDTLTFSLASAVPGCNGADNAKFQVMGTALQTNAILDFETSQTYQICVRVTDQAAATYEEAFTITVTGVNEAPTAIVTTPSPLHVAENLPSGTLVGTLSTTDPEAATQSFTYTFVNTLACPGPDNSSFAVTGLTLSDLVTTASFDFETKASYVICVRTTDDATPGLSFERQITIAVDNANDPPVDGDEGPLAVQSNVGITGNLLANASDPEGATMAMAAVSTGPFMTPGGGTIVIAMNGNFVYVPKPGDRGTSDSFGYTVTDGSGGTNTSTVSFSIDSNTIWFVAPAAGAPSGTGTIANPFTTLSMLNAAPDLAGEPIFVYAGTDALPSALTLQANQRLIGQGTTGGGTINTLLGLPDRPNTLALPPLTGPGSSPILGAASGNVITLATGNTLRGFTVGNRPNGTGIGGTSFGTLTISDLSITGTGAALDLTTGTIAGNFAGVTSTSSTTGFNVSLSAVQTTGTVDLGGGQLTGTGESLRITGQNGSFTYAGNITNPSPVAATRSVKISSKTGGTVALSGAIAGGAIELVSNQSGTTITFSGTQAITPSGSSAVMLTTLTGSTINFQGDLDITCTGSDAGVVASGAGTLNITGNGNTITTATGRALNLMNTVVGSGGIAFNSVSTGATATAITLNVVGGTGSLNIAGGTIAGVTSTGVDLTSVAIDVSIGATISDTASSTAHTVSIASSPNRTIAFSGAIDENGGGIVVAGTVGGTVNFTGGLDIDNVGSSTGFAASNAGTLNITGSNTIDAATGTGLDLATTDAGASGITFSHVNAAAGGMAARIATSNGTKILGTVSRPLSNATALTLNNAGAVTIGGASTSTIASGTTTAIVANSTNVGTTTLQLVGFGLDVTTTAGAGIVAGNATLTIGASGAGLRIVTTTGKGLQATAGGTLTVTGTSNSISTTSGTALDVVTTSIGVGGLTFKSIGASATPTTAIRVKPSSSTNAVLTVSGNGNLGQGGDASGGTIQNASGDAIDLANVNASFNNVSILTSAGTRGSGITGTGLTGLSFTNGRISTCGDSGVESCIALNSNPGGTNLSGALTITNNVLVAAYQAAVDVAGGSGTITNATITNNAIQGSSGSGINIAGSNSFALTKASITNNTLTSITNVGIQVAVSGPISTAGSSSTNLIAINNNSVTMLPIGSSAILMASGSPSGASTAYFEIKSNTLNGSQAAHTLLIGNNGFSTMTGTIDSNTIDSNHLANFTGASSIAGGNGQGAAPSNAATPNLTLTVTNNSLRESDGPAILLVGRGASGTANLKVTGNQLNTVPLSSVANPAIRVDSGNAGSGNETICLDVASNTTSAGSAGAPQVGLWKQTAGSTNTFGLVGLSAGQTDAQVNTFVKGRSSPNTGTTSVLNGLIGPTSGFTSCTIP